MERREKRVKYSVRLAFSILFRKEYSSFADKANCEKKSIFPLDEEEGEKFTRGFWSKRRRKLDLPFRWRKPQKAATEWVMMASVESGFQAREEDGADKKALETEKEALCFLNNGKGKKKQEREKRFFTFLVTNWGKRRRRKLWKCTKKQNCQFFLRCPEANFLSDLKGVRPTSLINWSRKEKASSSSLPYQLWVLLWQRFGLLPSHTEALCISTFGNFERKLKQLLSLAHLLMERWRFRERFPSSSWCQEPFYTLDLLSRIAQRWREKRGEEKATSLGKKKKKEKNAFGYVSFFPISISKSWPNIIFMM